MYSEASSVTLKLRHIYRKKRLSLSIFLDNKEMSSMNTTGWQTGADSYSAERSRAASFPLTYWTGCKTASSWTTREINDFLDKGGSQRRKHFSWGDEGEWGRWKDGGGEGGSGEGIHHLVRRSISFAWFVLSTAPTMQMTHNVEIETLELVSGVNSYMIARHAWRLKSFSIRWHFQYRALI